MELQKKLQEELDRYRAINKYGKKLVMEQEVPPTPADTNVPTDLPPTPEETPVDDTTAAPLPDVETPEPEMDSKEEIDITDLVDMVKSVKKGQEDTKIEHDGVLTKMDDVFTKLSDLEQKLSQMDGVLMKIDELGNKIESVREKTPQEKLEMRSLDSYPFNQNPQEFFAQKQGEMKASGKNEYVLTKQDVDDYSKDTIRNTFNPEINENEPKF